MTQLQQLFELRPSMAQQPRERVARAICENLLPGLADTLSGIVVIRGEVEAICWTATTWLDDGEYVCVTLDPGASGVKLFVDTAFPLRPHDEPPRWVNWAILAILAFGVATGWRYDSVWLGIAAVIVPAALWMTWDGVRDHVADKRAEARALDVAAWQARMERAIALADEAVN
jgi:hypothetical protein